MAFLRRSAFSWLAVVLSGRVAAAGTANLAPWLALLYSERIPVSDAPASSAHFATAKPMAKAPARYVLRFDRSEAAGLTVIFETSNCYQIHV